MYEEYNRDYEETKLELQPKKKNNFKKFVKVTTYAAVFGLVAGVTFSGYQEISKSIGTYFEKSADDIEETAQQAKVIQSQDSNTEDQTVKAVTTSNTDTTTGQTTDVSEIASNVMPSIVSINSIITNNIDMFGRRYQQQEEGSGSGIIVSQNKDSILIVTNNHVISGATKVQVTFADDSTADAQIKGADADSDLAVVEVKYSDLSKETLDTIRIATLGNSDEVKVGEMAIAIGNALGYGQSVTVGYISAKDRQISLEDSSSMTLLQTDAAINPGNSGGALVNAKGEVIGINSQKFASTEVEGMGYAIPISKAIPIVEELMNREEIPEAEQAYLGIRGEEVTEAYSQAFNMPIGLYIGEVTQNSPAERAGLKAGNIITNFNGKSVRSMEDLQEVLSYTKAGTQAEITIQVLNSGMYTEQILTVTLGSRAQIQS